MNLLSQYIQAAGPAGLLWIYLVLHLCIGLLLPYRPGMKPLFYMLMERAGIDLERRLNREGRPQSVRFIRGTLLALVLGGCGFLAGYDIQQVGKMTYGWMVVLLFLSLCVNFMAPLKVVRQIIRHLRKNELSAALQTLQPYFVEPLEKADVHTGIRKTVEFIADSLHTFLVAPAFWFLVAGPVGLALYTAYAGLWQAIKLGDDQRKYFGRTVRCIYVLLNIIPAMITAFILAFCALFVRGSNPWRAFKTIFAPVGEMRGRGWRIAALAGGLGITLGGPVRYNSDYAEEYLWIGPAGSSARLTVEDLMRASLLQYIFFICVIGILSTLVILAI